MRFDVVVRSVPNRLAVSEHDHLRRLMSDTCAVSKFARHLASVLNFNKYNFVIELLHLSVCRCAYRTCETMFENNYRSLPGVIKQAVCRTGIDDRLKCHFTFPGWILTLKIDDC